MRRIAARAPIPLLVVSFALSWAASAPRAARALQPAPERLVLTPAAGTTFRVQAVYPNSGVTCEAKRVNDLRARYRGQLEIVRESSGRLALIDHLTFDEYLGGLAEMPRSWPIEALKAQVVAARTYAIYQLEHPRSGAATLGYDICSTDQCQVYRGVSIEQGAFGGAWIRAVTETRGRVLRYGGRTIQAFYFSTSSGRTRRSFPGGSPLPYLASVDGKDSSSPIARWTVRVPFADLGTILHAGGDWPGGTVTGVALSGDTVRVTGGGRSVAITKGSFRFDLNDEGPCVFPGRYPTANAGGAKLPQTVPSIDFSLSTASGAVVLTGRGWGHDVGMSQYGAKALAETGRSFADILAYYYAGLRPVTITEPGAIRVLVAEGARFVRVGVEGSATVTTSTGSTLAPGDRFEVLGGKTLDVRRGIGPAIAPVLTVALGSTAPLSVASGGTISVSYTLSGPAKVSLSVRRAGAELFRTPELSQTSGDKTYALALDPASATPTPVTTSSPPDAGAAVAPTPMPPDAYEVTVVAYDGIDTVRSAPLALTVGARTPAERPAKSSGSKTLILIGGALLVAVLVGAGLLRRRPRPHA